MSTGGSPFQAALVHLGDLHRQELEHLRQEYEQQISVLRGENTSLKARLGGNGKAWVGEDGISPTDIIFESVQATPAAGTPTQANSFRKTNGHHHMENYDNQALVLYDSGRVESSCSNSKKNHGWEPLSELVGDFTIKDSWNRFIETRHWGANLDAYMFAGNLRASKHASLTQRSLVANAAAKSVEDSERQAAAREATLPAELRDVDHGCSIYPNSTFRLTWDLAGLVLISYDLITIPFNLAFNPDQNWFTIGMDWITLVFWSGDMLQGFFLGYFDKGLYVSDNRRILRHYMMTWFLPDAVVVAPEWLMTVLEIQSEVASSSSSEEGQASEMVKFLKGARAVRVLRLLRLLKLQRIINLLYDLIESEHTFICVNLAKLLLAVLVLNHVIACIWYLIGRICMENGMRNWIQVGDIESESIMYKYSTSMHWSLTQFTPASMDISARNVFERMFSIVVLFFAVVAFSSIVASITGSMTSLRNMKAEEMKQFWLLRRYLRQREVTPDLSDRIFKYLEHQTAKQSKLVQTNSLKATLPKLSLALQSELTHQLNSRFLVKHPFFQHVDANMSVVMHRLCHICLLPQSHAEKEVIFSAGDKASKMYFIKGKGACLEYVTVDGSRLEPPPHCEDWVGEAVLWTEWRHTGRLQSVIASDLIAVDPVQFVEIMCVHPRSWFFAKRYAAKFVDFLNTLDPREVIDIIRIPDFYAEAVKGCDTCEDYGEINALMGSEGMEDKCEAHEGDNDSQVQPGSAWIEGDRASRRSAASSASAEPPERRWGFVGLCPWAGSAPCEPWCNAGQKRR